MPPSLNSMVNGEYGSNVNSHNDGESIDYSLDFGELMVMNFDLNNSHINFEAIAAYEERHPLFKSELDFFLEKI